MPGAYDMMSQRLKSDKFDTTYTTLKQLKIFTDDYFMYANVNSPDSISAFGIGTYSTGRDTVTENVIYSAYDTTFNDTRPVYKLRVDKTGIGYKQFIPEITSQSGPVELTEEYRQVSIPETTPLDGAWKMERGYSIVGSDTTEMMGTQYKTYYGGQFIWGHTIPDSTSPNKIHTGVGFGTYTMSGENKVKEAARTSTYYQVRGKDFDIDVEMNGTDGFTQTMMLEDGTKLVEVYQRMKKE